jgi:hypothetical protein
VSAAAGEFPVNFLNLGVNAELSSIDAGFCEISTDFPVNSLLQSEICGFWAEFSGFGSEFGKLPVIFPVLPLFEDYLKAIELPGVRRRL